MNGQKPIPLKTQDNQHYWDMADQHELALQKCNDCGKYAHPPGPSCVHCGSTNLTWESLGNNIEATIYSYIISYRPFLPGFQDDLPLIIAQAELKQIPEIKLMCNLLRCNPENVQIGMPVKMIWDDITEDRALPQWVPQEV
ncbi:Zn-ribbon domain-containing OB-fold protein [Virgibacillus halodenitrificans]|uniref:OB-fold domain-containing protein n=1 Tax=Virgibacillus halodenitrificans TaxID=1482 RepID=A0ABR7VTS0_VIRHA|nr:OB-fold domain-containing protein [Virgibacillus halodenitrificans]MBD1224358.1 OB-fold domain-containing protein [Virgibacillus halodenitrificans]MCG1029354.1 OB-fold domain-containing protein [Virgibacillus halodenitrificans]MCJ0931450.1 zinc ribbon domain-containing protein [Virgibacillus halodenitrificans]MEC2158518.1 zinc ribbon domain-containing protein [Virgibacillus halodenitrificans]MYL47587.1 hypothetical protein [Virgibacillus halodenitrificans]